MIGNKIFDKTGPGIMVEMDLALSVNEFQLALYSIAVSKVTLTTTSRKINSRLTK